jgi:two-component system response regulator MtrA
MTPEQHVDARTGEDVGIADRLLLVEDDPPMRRIVALGLTQAGYDVTAVDDGDAALQALDHTTFSAVILDLMLPGVDGWEVCRRIRAQGSLPIVMVTARADTVDVVAGLESGADDYVTKPFEMPELLARVRAVLRRTAGDAPEPAIVAGSISVDPDTFTARRDGVELDLTATEFRVLAELARRAGRVCTREFLLERVWGFDYLGTSRAVDMTVLRLREKVEPDPSHPQLLHTIRGVGYKLDGG